MKYQFKAKLLKDGNIFTRLINTLNLQSAIFIAEYLYGKDCKILSVEETKDCKILSVEETKEIT